MLKAEDIKKLPASAGVYYFYDASGTLLYVGKSVHIRNRVMSHFSQDHKNPKDLQINNKLAHVDFETTPPTLVPRSARVTRLRRYHLSITGGCANQKALPVPLRGGCQWLQRIAIEAVELDCDDVDERFGLFRSPRQASKQIEKLADRYFLCHKLLGLESDTGAASNKPCFRAQLKKCFGACQGAEEAAVYNQRVTTALNNYQLKMWPYPGAIMIEERDMQAPENAAFHLVHNWRYLARLTLVEDLYDQGYQLAQSQQT